MQTTRAAADDAVKPHTQRATAAFMGGPGGPDPRGPIYKISYDLAYDYRNFIVRSTQDSDLTCAEISLRECRKLIYDAIFDDITILHVNLTYEKLSIHCKMFCKLDVRRKLIVTLALS